MRIVIVDDDPFSRQILRITLGRMGHEVVELTDGEEAWEYLLKEPARFLITDWLMPRLDGLELIQRIRGHSFPGYMYIIILTGKEAKSDTIAGLEVGADDFLVKPFNVHELHARIGIGARILDLEDNLNQARQKIEVMALHDSLTNLLNRRGLYRHLEAELNRSDREARPLSLALFDMDGFKLVNEQHGHQVGDQALCLVSEVIKQKVRSYDWVGRWGADEFLAILPGASVEDASAVIERIRAGIHQKPLILPDGVSLDVQVSIGLNTHLVGPGELDDLIQRTGHALDQAKEKGPGQVAVYNTHLP